MSGEARILVVEDDRNLAVGLQSALKASGFSVSWADSSSAALNTLQNGSQPDLILSDVMMRGADGFAFRQQISQLPWAAEIPFIFLTAKDDVPSKLYGLGLGADDYVCKPFDVAELIARVRAVLRRTQQPSRAEPEEEAEPVGISSKHLLLDVENGDLSMPQGVTLSLTPTECSIMEVLMREPGHPFSRADLVRAALGYFPDESSKKIINAHIYNIRRKMRQSAESAFIRYKRSWGYYVD